ncbi:hypothetical protein CZP2022_236 [Vibrio phage C-ZP2022]|nr:hypothetical protein CZP2022_236 [Vibrio phage C-ZP2022]
MEDQDYECDPNLAFDDPEEADYEDGMFAD